MLKYDIAPAETNCGDTSSVIIWKKRTTAAAAGGYRQGKKIPQAISCLRYCVLFNYFQGKLIIPIM